MPINMKPAPESSSDSDKRFRGTVIISTLIVMITSIALLLFDIIHLEIGKTVLIISVVLIFLSLLLVFLRNILLPAQVITPTAVFLVLSFFIISGDGVRDGATIAFPAVALIAGLLLGGRGAIIFGFLTTAAIAAIGFAELNGYLVTPLSSFLDFREANAFWVLNLATALIAAFLIRRLAQAADSAKLNERIQAKANEELTLLKDTLEEQVLQRTSELNNTAQALESRAQQLQAIADVSQTVAVIKDLKALLPTITRQISRYFDFYHVGIFLLDNAEKHAVLEAANSVEGQKMLENGHQLAVGEVSIVSAVAREKQARIALDVDADTTYFDNPILPETRSEMALPLVFGDQIIGVLDVQSKREAAFTEEDTNAFTTLANQVAIAIENARQLEKTQGALDEARRASRENIQQAWLQFSSEKREKEYRYEGKDASISKSNDSENILSVPVQIQDQLIGVLKIRKNASVKTTKEEDLELVEAIAARVALALENARLVESSQRLATKEQVIGEISEKLNATTRIENLMQVAVKELQDVLGASDVVLQIEEPKKQE